MRESVKELTVLSLFDGISVGLQALKNLNIPLRAYYTSEIDDLAIKVSKNNHKEDWIYRAGDVRYINGDVYPAIDLLIGGNPCVSFSCAGRRQGFKQKTYTLKDYYHYLSLKHSGVNFEGESYLFWEFVRLYREICPKFFFLENTHMSQESQDIISSALHVEPIRVDSGSFSAQSRVRLYWTNIPIDVKSIPKDSGVYVKDVIMKQVHSKYWIKGKNFYPVKSHRSERGLKCIGGLAKETEKPWKRRDGSYPELRDITSCSEFRQNQRVYSLLSKSPTVTKVNYAIYQFDHYKHRKLRPLELERLQTLPDCYTIGLSDRERSQVIGNAWNTKTIEFFFTPFTEGLPKKRKKLYEETIDVIKKGGL